MTRGTGVPRRPRLATRSILESISDGVFTVDEDCRRTTASDDVIDR